MNNCVCVFLFIYTALATKTLHDPVVNTEYETIIQTPETINLAPFAKEVIITPSETLLRLPVDKLPLEYWVPSKKSSLRYWPNRTISVQMDSSLSWSEQKVIWTALEALSFAVDKCILFIRKGWHESDYLKFRKGNYCYSRIGYQGGEHKIKLSDDCLLADELGSIQHEVLHALGFFHEHSRRDRDNWVDINWKNVKPRDKKEFSKLKFRTYDLPYDYLSVLHYASDAYAINETIPTVKPRIPVVSITTIGQRKGLSPTDVKRVKMPYMCGDRATDAATWNKYGLDRREFARSKTNQIL